MTARARRGVRWGIVFGAGAAVAGAQTAAVTVPCRGQRVDSIHIYSQAPTVTGVRSVPVVAEVVRAVHVTTRETVIERFLLLHVGDACSERRRAESERVLRAQPFLADATVQVVRSGSGGVNLEVNTVDEVAAVFSATLKPKAPVFTGLRLGDANVSGGGVYAAGMWWHERALRDGYAARVTDYQFLGQPVQATALAARNPLGGEYHLDVQRPFLTDLQRVAWRAQQGEADDYVRFVDAAGGIHADRLTRAYTDVGGLTRIGPPGRLALVGLSVSHESESASNAPIVISDEGTAPDSSGPWAAGFASHSVSRVNALLGYRNLRFVRATGFDALQHTQDIPVGIQIGGLIGKSAPLGDRVTDRDMLFGADAYAGAASSRSALRFQAMGEVRRVLDSASWDGLLGSGRVAEYQKIGMSQTAMASVEWSGGWRARVPFRVTLAGVDGGVRGMPEGVEQGARRGIMRLEDRFDMRSPFGETADFALAVFADAGRLWAGDAPFGTTTPMRYSAGFSLLTAFPARSAQMWRLDVAFPNVPGRGVRLALRLTHTDATSVFWREPADVAVARERSVPASLFNWP